MVAKQRKPHSEKGTTSAPRSAVPKSSPKARLAAKSSKGSRARKVKERLAGSILGLHRMLFNTLKGLWWTLFTYCTSYRLERLGPRLKHKQIEWQSPDWMAAPINTWILMTMREPSKKGGLCSWSQRRKGYPKKDTPRCRVAFGISLLDNTNLRNP